MSIFSTKTKHKSNSTFRRSESDLLDLIIPIEEYKTTEEITEESLARPFDQVRTNILQIYKYLYNRGINV